MSILNDIQRSNTIGAIQRLQVAHRSVSGMNMTIALPQAKPTSDKAKQLRQAIGLLLATIESGDEKTIAAQTREFESYVAPLIEAELIRTGWYPKMATDAEKAWLGKAIPAFTDNAVESAKQRVAQACSEAPNWAR